jgi:RNA polymerase sigma-70 factor (ECF subfamily)
VVTRASLIGRLKDLDDQTAWGEFDRAYGRVIIGFAMRRGLSEQEAKDVAQETWLSVAKDIGEFEYDPARSSFKNWLFTVARHRIIDHCRRRPKELPAAALDHDDDGTSTSAVERLPDQPSQTLDDVWEAEWRQALLDQAMDRIKADVSAEHFQIFYLSVIKEQPVAKVAAALGVNVAKVYVVRHRLAPRLKKLLALLQRELG